MTNSIKMYVNKPFGREGLSIVLAVDYTPPSFNPFVAGNPIELTRKQTIEFSKLFNDFLEKCKKDKNE